jgi:hypothetical protein
MMTEIDYDNVNQFLKIKIFCFLPKRVIEKVKSFEVLMSSFEVGLFLNRMLQPFESPLVIKRGTVKRVSGAVIDGRKPLVDDVC